MSYKGTGDKADLDNHSDQCNSNNPEHAGHKPEYSGKGDKADLDNHSNQSNTNNPGKEEKPAAGYLARAESKK